MIDEYKIVPVNGHYDVYIDGKFYCSADTMPEAINDVKEARKEREVVTC